MIRHRLHITQLWICVYREHNRSVCCYGYCFHLRFEHTSKQCVTYVQKQQDSRSRLASQHTRGMTLYVASTMHSCITKSFHPASWTRLSRFSYFSIKWRLIFSFFYRAMHVVQTRYCYRKSYVRLSVCLSVTLTYRGHRGWTSSKLITRISSLGSSLLAATTSAI